MSTTPDPTRGPAPTPEVLELAAQPTAVIDGVAAPADLPAFFDHAFSALPAALAAQRIAIVGPAFALYHELPGETMDLEVGFPTDRPVEPSGDVRPGTTPDGRAARLVHHGSFDGLGSSWERLRTWMEAEGHVPGTGIWEVYVTEPSPEMDPADLRTELYWPVA